MLTHHFSAMLMLCNIDWTPSIIFSRGTFFGVTAKLKDFNTTDIVDVDS